jgi:hypothetical protein
MLLIDTILPSGKEQNKRHRPGSPDPGASLAAKQAADLLSGVRGSNNQLLTQLHALTTTIDKFE